MRTPQAAALPALLCSDTILSIVAKNDALSELRIFGRRKMLLSVLISTYPQCL